MSPSTEAPHTLRAAVRRHPLISFFVFTFLYSWGVRVPTIFVPQWPAVLSFTAMFGPAFAAALVLLLSSEQKQAARLFRSLFQWRAAPQWYAAALLLPAALIAAPLLINRVVWPTTSQASSAPALLPVAGLVLVNFAYLILLVWGEEIGWRGFALPRLQAKMSPLAASALLGVIWGVWHLPSFWIPGSTQAFIPIPVYLLYILGHTFLYSWIYNGTRGSLLLVCLHHAATNAFTVALAAFPAFAALIARPATLLLGVALAVGAVILFTRATLLAERTQGTRQI